jgi:hypothetical protein
VKAALQFILRITKGVAENVVTVWSWLYTFWLAAPRHHTYAYANTGSDSNDCGYANADIDGPDTASNACDDDSSKWRHRHHIPRSYSGGKCSGTDASSACGSDDCIRSNHNITPRAKRSD